MRSLAREFQLGGVTLFKRNIEAPEQVAELSHDLQSLSSTVTMLLQLARLSSVPTESAEIDLAAVAARVAADHVPAALASGYSIEFSRPAEPIKVNGP